MRPVRCLPPANAGDRGDCFRACVASILGLPAEEVPHFTHEADEQFVKAARDWLRPRGLTIFERHFEKSWTLDELLKWVSGNSPGTPIIITGRCAVDHTDSHAVVALDGKIVHDPSDSGVDGPCEALNYAEPYWWIYIIALADTWTERKAA